MLFLQSHHLVIQLWSLDSFETWVYVNLSSLFCYPNDNCHAKLFEYRRKLIKLCLRVVMWFLSTDPLHTPSCKIG